MLGLGLMSLRAHVAEPKARGGQPARDSPAPTRYPHVCGKPSWRCTADPTSPTVPDHRWTRQVARKTVTRRLPDEQERLYGPWSEEARRRALLSELGALVTADRTARHHGL